MSNLLAVGKKFITASLRYDLITGTLASHTDNGANYFINAGQRFLDLKADLQRRHKAVLASGEFTLEIQNLISIDEVHIIDSDSREEITANRVTRAELYAQVSDLFDDWETIW